MKIAHLSDLHLGKKVNGFSMTEDQKYILNQITNIIADEQADAVIIAGDIYDKAVPSAEAVVLFDSFLNSLDALGVSVFIISGNHDCAERLSFAGSLLKKNRVYISAIYRGSTEPIELGENVCIYMMPFIKPAYVRAYCGDEKIETYNDAVKFVLDGMDTDKSKFNILVAHQFVTGAIQSDSEEVSVGGVDNIDASLFDQFDYVALGHIHRPQKILRDTVRYCGSPLKYSFSEANVNKSVTIADVENKNVKITKIPLVPLHDMRAIKGSYEQLTLRKNYEGTVLDDYLHITLTDENDIENAVEKLRSIYPNIMQLDYDNTRTRSLKAAEPVKDVNLKSDLEIFNDLYTMQNNRPMSREQAEFFEKIASEVREEQQ